jgi:hypothetical protein
VYVAEPLSWHVDGLDRSCWLAGDLAPAALLAIPHPGGHVRVHTSPHRSGRYQPPSSACAGVHQSVEGVKNRSPVHYRYQRPQAAGRRVTKQAGPHHLYSLKLEGGGLTGLQRCRAAQLVFGDGGEIDELTGGWYRENHRRLVPKRA